MLPVGPGGMRAPLPAPLGTQLGGSREQLPLTEARLLLLPRPPGGHWKSLPVIFGTCRYSVLTSLPDNADPIAYLWKSVCVFSVSQPALCYWVFSSFTLLCFPSHPILCKGSFINENRDIPLPLFIGFCHSSRYRGYRLKRLRSQFRDAQNLSSKVVLSFPYLAWIYFVLSFCRRQINNKRSKM